MTKLLTEQKLREKITFIFDKVNPEFTYRDEVEEILSLIQSQKLAHGEMLIGDIETNQLYGAAADYRRQGRNQLRAEQRNRNKAE